MAKYKKLPGTPEQSGSNEQPENQNILTDAFSFFTDKTFPLSWEDKISIAEGEKEMPRDITLNMMRHIGNEENMQIQLLHRGIDPETHDGFNYRLRKYSPEQQEEIKNLVHDYNQRKNKVSAATGPVIESFQQAGEIIQSRTLPVNEISIDDEFYQPPALSQENIPEEKKGPGIGRFKAPTTDPIPQAKPVVQKAGVGSSAVDAMSKFAAENPVEELETLTGSQLAKTASPFLHMTHQGAKLYMTGKLLGKYVPQALNYGRQVVNPSFKVHNHHIKTAENLLQRPKVRFKTAEKAIRNIPKIAPGAAATAALTAGLVMLPKKTGEGAQLPMGESQRRDHALKTKEQFQAGEIDDQTYDMRMKYNMSDDFLKDIEFR